MNGTEASRVSRLGAAFGLALLVAFLAAVGLLAYQVYDSANQPAPELVVQVSVAGSGIDTPEQLRRYARAHGVDRQHWRLLTGDIAERRKIETACMQQSLVDSKKPQGQQYQHTPLFFLVDAKGVVRTKYSVIEAELHDDGIPSGQFRINEAELAKLLRDAANLAAGGRLESKPAIDREIEEFKLVDQEGETFTRADMAGKVCLVAFFACECTLSCSKIAEALTEIQQHTGPARRSAVLPAANAILNSTSAVLLILGFGLIRFGRVRGHVACMLAAVCVSTLFLISYVYYHFFVAAGQPTQFSGPSAYYRAYLAVLMSHIVLAAALIPLVGTILFLAATDRWRAHRILARITLPIWIYVSVTGVAIYWVLYQLYPPAV